MKTRLILEDGTVFVGKAFGAVKESIGEVVFNTSPTGYQEILSDPSACGQIVAMTYPLLGNYGVNRDDFESARPYIHGVVAREHCKYPSNFRSQQTLDSWLKEHDIPGISEIDTRMLTRVLRERGTMRGAIAPLGAPVEEVVATLKAKPKTTNQVSIVSTNQVYRLPGSGTRVVVIDFGVKDSVLRALANRRCDITVVPRDATAREIRRLSPDGVVLSNGPGDPKDVAAAVEVIQQLIGEFPIMGIGLGHQLFALANGADTEKMKFGHRGANHPVKDLENDRTYITFQNHGYAVTLESARKTDLLVTHVAVNDGTVEGLRHKTLPAFSTQFHPASAPCDTTYLFDRFLEMVAQFKKGDYPNAVTF